MVVAASAAIAVRPSPMEMTHFSPNLSAIAPHATSVRTMPKVGAAARVPACVNERPCSECSSGIKKAGVLTKTVPAAWAATPIPSIVHAMGETAVLSNRDACVMVPSDFLRCSTMPTLLA